MILNMTFNNLIVNINKGFTTKCSFKKNMPQNFENSCVLHYKSKEPKATSYSFLNEDDFVLITMAEAQGEMKKKWNKLLMY